MSFLGAWLVTEYVYNPNGRFAGIIQQRRELEQLDNGRIRLTQHCQPSAELDGHPMARFTGKPVFELSVDGRIRCYHGPAVLGTGLAWGEGAMTGRGVWPEFGHNFRSFSVLATPNRQLTGGQFFNATEMIANIAGVAVPETEGAVYPTIDHDTTAYETSPIWNGRYRQLSAAGALIQEVDFERRYTENGRWHDVISTDHDYFFDIQPEQNRILAQINGETGVGFVKTFGWMWEAELVTYDGWAVEIKELLDASEGHLVSLRHWLKDGQLEQVEVLRLRPLDK